VLSLLALASMATTQDDLRCAATMQRAQAMHDPTSGKNLGEDSNDLIGPIQFYLGRLSAEEPGKDWHAVMVKTAESMTDPDEAVLKGVQLCIFRAFRLSTGDEKISPDAARKILEHPNDR
jgi:hypothetical protein